MSGSSLVTRLGSRLPRVAVLPACVVARERGGPRDDEDNGAFPRWGAAAGVIVVVVSTRVVPSELPRRAFQATSGAAMRAPMELFRRAPPPGVGGSGAVRAAPCGVLAARLRSQ